MVVGNADRLELGVSEQVCDRFGHLRAFEIQTSFNGQQSIRLNIGIFCTYNKNIKYLSGSMNMMDLNSSSLHKALLLH
jgi:hypothetical protein